MYREKTQIVSGDMICQTHAQCCCSRVSLDKVECVTFSTTSFSNKIFEITLAQKALKYSYLLIKIRYHTCFHSSHNQMIQM